jgi:glycosyltransferase involved in cell wall biosynthesis
LKNIWIVCEQNASLRNPYGVVYQYKSILEKSGYKVSLFFGNSSCPEFCKAKGLNVLSEIQTMSSDSRPSLVIFYSFHKVLPEFKFISDSGVPILNRPDSDGRVVLKYFPIAILKKMLLQQKGIINKLRCTKYWLQRLIFETRKQLNEVIENCERSTLLAFPSPGCVSEFNYFLSKEKRGDLIGKNKFVPYLVGDQFFDCVDIKKEKRIGVIANWEGDTGCNKNPHLVRGVFDVVLQQHPDLILTIIGKGTAALFSKWCQFKKNVELYEHVENNNICDLMKRFRFLIISSSHEGSPRVANEMLVLGGTLVGGPLPGLIGLVGRNEYGTVAPNFSVRSLVSAVNCELKMWDKGLRNEKRISEIWREQFHQSKFVQVVKEIIQR